MKRNDGVKMEKTKDGRSQENQSTRNKSSRNNSDVTRSEMGPLSENASVAKKEEQPKNKIVSFATDDFKIRRMVSSAKDLPLGKYTSLGAILEQKAMKQAFMDAPLPVTNMKKDIFTKQHILGPLPPGKPERTPTSIPAQTEAGPRPFEEAELPMEGMMAMPLEHRDAFNQPFPPHDGLIWPIAWAPRPPYASPGYNRLGVRQPVGVIQVDRVPTVATRGRTIDKEFELPTWVSPLYRSYGVGGPFGPFGPFYEPPDILKVAEDSAFRVELSTTPTKTKTKKNGLFGFLEGTPKEDNQQIEKDDKSMGNFLKTKTKKGGLFGFLWGTPKEDNQQIEKDDKSMGNFLSILDENLVAMRHVLRLKKEEKEIMSSVVQNLTHILDDAKKVALKLEDESLSTTAALSQNGNATFDLAEQ